MTLHKMFNQTNKIFVFAKIYICDVFYLSWLLLHEKKLEIDFRQGFFLRAGEGNSPPEIGFSQPGGDYQVSL